MKKSNSALCNRRKRGLSKKELRKKDAQKSQLTVDTKTPNTQKLSLQDIQVENTSEESPGRRSANSPDQINLKTGPLVESKAFLKVELQEKNYHSNTVSTKRIHDVSQKTEKVHSAFQSDKDKEIPVVQKLYELYPRPSQQVSGSLEHTMPNEYSQSNLRIQAHQEMPYNQSKHIVHTKLQHRDRLSLRRPSNYSTEASRHRKNSQGDYLNNDQIDSIMRSAQEIKQMSLGPAKTSSVQKNSSINKISHGHSKSSYNFKMLSVKQSVDLSGENTDKTDFTKRQMLQSRGGSVSGSNFFQPQNLQGGKLNFLDAAASLQRSSTADGHRRSKTTLQHQQKTAERLHSGFLSNKKKQMFTQSDLKSQFESMNRQLNDVILDAEQKSIQRIETILNAKKSHKEINERSSQSQIFTEPDVYQKKEVEITQREKQQLKIRKGLNKARFSERLAYRMNQQLMRNESKQKDSIDSSSMDKSSIKKDLTVGKASFKTRSSSQSNVEQSFSIPVRNEYGFYMGNQVDNSNYVDLHDQLRMSKKTVAQSIAMPKKNKKLEEKFEQTFQKKTKAPQKLVEWYENYKENQKIPITQDEIFLQQAIEYRNKVKRKLAESNHHETIKKQNAGSITQNKKDEDIFVQFDRAEEIQRSKYKILLNCLGSLHTIQMKFRTSKIDTKKHYFIKGCRHMNEREFKQALQNFRWMKQNIGNVKESVVGSSMFEDSLNESSEEGQDAAQSSIDQDMIDFDSHFSKFELPKKLYHLDDDLHPKSDLGSESELDIDAVSHSFQKSDSISTSNRADLLPEDKFFLAAGTLNSAYCIAQCGYLSRAVTAIYKALGNDFDGAIMANLSILNLLRKKPDYLQSLLYLKLCVSEVVKNQNNRLNLMKKEQIIKRGNIILKHIRKIIAYETPKQCSENFEAFSSNIENIVTKVKNKKTQNKDRLFYKAQIDLPPIAVAEKLKRQFEDFQKVPAPHGIQIKLIKATFFLQHFINHWDVKDQDVFDGFLQVKYEKEHKKEINNFVNQVSNFKKERFNNDQQANTLIWNPKLGLLTQANTLDIPGSIEQVSKESKEPQVGTNFIKNDQLSVTSSSQDRLQKNVYNRAYMKREMKGQRISQLMNMRRSTYKRDKSKKAIDQLNSLSSSQINLNPSFERSAANEENEPIIEEVQSPGMDPSEPMQNLNKEKSQSVKQSLSKGDLSSSINNFSEEGDAVAFLDVKPRRIASAVDNKNLLQMNKVMSTEKGFATKKLVPDNLLNPLSLQKKKTNDLTSKLHEKQEQPRQTLMRGKFMHGTQKLIGDSMATVDVLDKFERIALDGQDQMIQLQRLDKNLNKRMSIINQKQPKPGRGLSARMDKIRSESEASVSSSCRGSERQRIKDDDSEQQIKRNDSEISSDANSDEVRKRLAMFENTNEQRNQIMAQIKDNDIQEHVLDEKGLHAKDLHKVRQNDARRLYLLNKTDVKNLANRVKYLRWYFRQRKNALLQNQIDRIQEMRKYRSFAQRIVREKEELQDQRKKLKEGFFEKNRKGSKLKCALQKDKRRIYNKAQKIEVMIQRVKQSGHRQPKVDEKKELVMLKNSFAHAFSKKPVTSVYNHKLRLEELEIIRQYYIGIKANKILNFDYAWECLKKFSFWSHWTQEIAKKMIRSCDIRMFNKDEVIFKQNDASTEIFFILKGSVALSFTKAGWEGVEIISNTYYDGRRFGELVEDNNQEGLTMHQKMQLEDFKDKSKTHTVLNCFPYPSQHLLTRLPKMLDYSRLQKETARANEESYICVFNKKELKNIWKTDIAEDTDGKMKYLRSIDIFKDLQDETLLPIVNQIQTKKYTYGQVILEEGKKPLGLYLILKGNCRVGLLSIGTDKKMRSKNSWNRKKERNMKFGKSVHEPKRYNKDEENTDHFDPTRYDSDDNSIRKFELSIDKDLIKDAQASDGEGDSELKDRQTPKRIFMNQIEQKNYTQKYKTPSKSPSPVRFGDGMKIKEMEESKEFKYSKWTEYFKLQAKDYFGGRVLFNLSADNDETEVIDVKSKKKDDMSLKPVFQVAPSMLNVLADSAEVEVMMVDRVIWSMFPENIQKDLIAKLKRNPSFERPYEPEYLEFKKHLSEKWDKDKLKNYQKHIDNIFFVREGKKLF